MIAAAIFALPLLAPRTSDARRPVETVHVTGDYCPEVEQRCLRWLPNSKDVVGDEKLRCAEFAPSPKSCKKPLRHLSFEIDRYEYPGEPGELPMVHVSWVHAQALCAQDGKRLCTEEEWTLACEGSERWPYPYGHKRDAQACNIDLSLRDASGDEGRKAHRAGIPWMTPIDRREPSGSRPRCQSPFGVFDMTGNVDEWVDGRAQGHASSSMGGYWGPVRNRCRAVTRAHKETFSFYQTGFRCCK